MFRDVTIMQFNYASMKKWHRSTSKMKAFHVFALLLTFFFGFFLALHPEELIDVKTILKPEFILVHTMRKKGTPVTSP